MDETTSRDTASDLESSGAQPLPSNGEAHPVQPPLSGNSTTTKDGKVERHDLLGSGGATDDFEVPPAKRAKTEDAAQPVVTDESRFKKGVVPIKEEYLIPKEERLASQSVIPNDDAAEAAGHDARSSQTNGKDTKKAKQKGGQNTNRRFGSSRDSIALCSSRILSNEFSPEPCSYGAKCKFEHDIRRYLADGKRVDLDTFGGICPVWDARGVCNAGWKCRFVKSHSKERDTEDGKKELILIEDEERKARCGYEGIRFDEIGVANVVSATAKVALHKRKMKTPKADLYTEWLSKESETSKIRNNQKKPEGNGDDQMEVETRNLSVDEEKQDHRASYTEPPLLPSEKRRIYYGPETPVLAPLTTQGNLPFRRLCVELGAQVTWSEMAMGLPLIQGEKGEWALMKAHESETLPPQLQANSPIVQGYDNSKDLKFGVQVAANKPWVALKTTEVLTALCPHLRAIDLNCGCPIDLIYRQGAGSALLDQGGKLEKILRGMNAVSNDIPITVKIRMGTKDGVPTADRLVRRLVLGGEEAKIAGLGPCGIAAVTLHGRSRQQRYSRLADWTYISEIATLIKNIQKESDQLADTINEADARYQANGGKVYFVGNGDCYSHADYYEHLDKHKVDSVMVARGALIKPWIFEEIAANQYLDKSASERLSYIEKFARYGLEAWGSDEIGVGNTRRFLLEWLSFSCRYVPLGLLERLPPNIQERPPPFRGRNELETLLASGNYKDWIKISEMFLGPAHPDFRFEPKHKSNSYEIEAEG